MKLLPLCLAPYLLIYLHLNNAIKYATATEIPECDFMDTVNITDSTKFSNGSYIFENVIIPPNLIGVYHYDLVNGTQRVTVPAHVRGCVCKLKSCVKFCCHPNKIKLVDSFECSEEMGEELQYSPLVDVTLKNGSRQLMHVLDEFVVQRGIPCHDGYSLLPELEKADEWELFENGTLLRLYDMAALSKSEYCLTPSEINGSYILNPINCPIYNEKSNSEKINGIMMLISIPFLVVTIIVYLVIPKLRNLHGKCLICYLVALALGYTMLVIVFFEDAGESYSSHLCSSLGFIGYFCFLSAFFWLSVISFDLWYHFHIAQGNSHRFIQRKRFFIYSTYAWGIPLLMTALTYYAQNSDLDYELKPGIGMEYCWLNTELWSPMIYFYGPILLLMIFNLTMFVLTALKIYKVQKDLARIVALEESTKHLCTQKDNFGLFLRLFIVMGVTWLLEVFSYMVGMDNIWAYFFIIPDVCNAAQGVIIFALFVFRRKVKILIMKRIFHRNTASSRSNSTNSEVSADEISLQETAKMTGLSYFD